MDALFKDFHFPVELQLSGEGFLLLGFELHCLLKNSCILAKLQFIFLGILATRGAAIVPLQISASPTEL